MASFDGPKPQKTQTSVNRVPAYAVYNNDLVLQYSPNSTWIYYLDDIVTS